MLNQVKLENVGITVVVRGVYALLRVVVNPAISHDRRVADRDAVNLVAAHLQSVEDDTCSTITWRTLSGDSAIGAPGNNGFPFIHGMDQHRAGRRAARVNQLECAVRLYVGLPRGVIKSIHKLERVTGSNPAERVL